MFFSITSMAIFFLHKWRKHLLFWREVEKCFAVLEGKNCHFMTVFSSVHGEYVFAIMEKIMVFLTGTISRPSAVQLR